MKVPLKCTRSMGVLGAQTAGIPRGRTGQGRQARELGRLPWDYPAEAGGSSISRCPGCCSVLGSPWKACPDCVWDLISASASRL